MEKGCSEERGRKGEIIWSILTIYPTTVNSRLANIPLLRTKFRSPSIEDRLKMTLGIMDSHHSSHKTMSQSCPL